MKKRYYREFKKFQPDERFLPTWSSDEVLAFFTFLEDLVNDGSLEITQGSTREAKNALDSSDEIARNVVDNPQGIPVFLTKERLSDRFFHRGGVVRLLFKPELPGSMRAVSSGQICAELRSKILKVRFVWNNAILPIKAFKRLLR